MEGLESSFYLVGINVVHLLIFFIILAIRGFLAEPDPPESGGCSKINPPPGTDSMKKWILLVPRYNNFTNCSFEQKIRIAQAASFSAVIVYNIDSDNLIPMAASNSTGINIPSVFVGETSGLELRGFTYPDYFVVITAESHFNIQTQLLIPFAIVVGICFIVMIIFMVSKIFILFSKAMQKLIF